MTVQNVQSSGYDIVNSFVFYSVVEMMERELKEDKKMSKKIINIIYKIMSKNDKDF